MCCSSAAHVLRSQSTAGSGASAGLLHGRSPCEAIWRRPMVTVAVSIGRRGGLSPSRHMVTASASYASHAAVGAWQRAAGGIARGPSKPASLRSQGRGGASVWRALTPEPGDTYQARTRPPPTVSPCTVPTLSGPRALEAGAHFQLPAPRARALRAGTPAPAQRRRSRHLQ
jgi:hypothetical protein